MLYGMIGYSSLNYSAEPSEVSGGLGGGFGIGYAYNFTPRWSIATGLELAVLRSTATNDQLSGSVKVVYNYQGTPEDLYLHSVLTGYEERQRATYLSLPLMVRFAHPLSRSAAHRYATFYAAIGPKIGLSIASSYEATAITLARTLEFTVPGVIAGGSNPAHDIGITRRPALSSGSLSLKPKLAAAAEAGIRWKLNRQGWHLYTGLYADYSLLNVAPSATGELIDPSTVATSAFTGNSILTAQNLGKAYAGAMHPLFAGLKVTLSFGKQPPYHEEPAQAATSVDDAKELERLAAACTSCADSLKDEREATRRAQNSADNYRRQLKNLQMQDSLATAARVQYVTAVEVIQKPIIINYQLSHTDLSDEAKEELDLKVDLMKLYPNMHVLIEGHTCDMGTPDENIILAQKRADSVKDYLVQYGIAPERIRAVSKGQTEPLVPNTSEANRKKNRRVHLIVEE
jgi:outer membrane protein OmpA-like peptidoglycan-associated protein